MSVVCQEIKLNLSVDVCIPDFRALIFEDVVTVTASSEVKVQTKSKAMSCPFISFQPKDYSFGSLNAF